MSGSEKCAACVSLYIIAMLSMVSSDNHVDGILQERDVVFDAADDVDPHRSEFVGALQLGKGWCLDASSRLLGDPVKVKQCKAGTTIPAAQRWSYDANTGLLKVAGGNLCLHADYVSEPEGALTSLQPCHQSERQNYLLDQDTELVHLKSNQDLCLQSLDAVHKDNQPVLLMPCGGDSISTADKLSEDAALSESTLEFLAGDLKENAESPDSRTDAVKTEVSKPAMPTSTPKNLAVQKPLHLPESPNNTVESEPPVERLESHLLHSATKVPRRTAEQLSKAPRKTPEQLTIAPGRKPNHHANPISKARSGGTDASSRSKVRSGDSSKMVMSIKAQLISALNQVDEAVRERRNQERLIEKQLQHAKAATEKAHHVATSLQRQTPNAVMLAMRQAKTEYETKRVDIVKKEQLALKRIVSHFESYYHQMANEAKTHVQNSHKMAAARSSVLQHDAKQKASFVVANTRTRLQKVLKLSLRTLTESTDKRQQARSKLMKLHKQHADEVTLAESALKLAKVNKATRLADTEARRAARLAKVRASRDIRFARTMLASRLKAIHSTAHLAVDKAELKSRAKMAEAQEMLSRAKQHVLMALDAAESSIPLEEVVGKEGVVQVKQESSDERVASNIAPESMRDYAQMEQTSGVDGLDDGEDLLASPITQEDTIYTAKMHRCIFPFISNGQKYFHCRQSPNGHWCATSVDQNQKIQDWDYCILDHHAVKLARQAAMEAAQMEVKRVLAATGATISPAALRESLRAAAAAQQGPATTNGGGQNADAKYLAVPWALGQKQAASNVDQMIDTAEDDSAQSRK
jgi:hypothetical protein